MNDEGMICNVCGASEAEVAGLAALDPDECDDGLAHDWQEDDR